VHETETSRQIKSKHKGGEMEAARPANEEKKKINQGAEHWNLGALKRKINKLRTASSAALTLQKQNNCCSACDSEQEKIRHKKKKKKKKG
jgi:hypothetical protein